MTARGPLDAARAEALRGWLRRARGCPGAGGLVLRGSLFLQAICAGARPAMDVDYVVPGPFDPEALERLARAITERPDDGTTIVVERCEIIFGETPFPGLRVFATGESAEGSASFQVDFAHGDPLPAAPREVAIAGVGGVQACTAEALFGWKLHGLVEFGRGTWRAKDLFDLWLLRTRVPLDREALLAAVRLAFSSRSAELSALSDFRSRESWGESRSGRRRWRILCNKHPVSPPFAEARAVVRAAVEELLGAE